MKYDTLFSLLCSVDPTHVIGLYPDLLPSDYRKQLHYPNPLPTLSGAELEKAHLALIDYLTQVCVCLDMLTEIKWQEIKMNKKHVCYTFCHQPVFNYYIWNEAHVRGEQF